jgi:hypothetical protein
MPVPVLVPVSVPVPVPLPVPLPGPVPVPMLVVNDEAGGSEGLIQDPNQEESGRFVRGIEDALSWVKDTASDVTTAISDTMSKITSFFG